jgi:hypothetical protein
MTTKANFIRWVYTSSMILRGRTLAQMILTLGVGALLSMNVFGILHTGMSMNMDGMATPCPFMPGMNVCPMSPLEHVSQMQSLFTSIPQTQDIVLALILAIGLMAFAVAPWLRNLLLPNRTRVPRFFYRYRNRSIPRLLQKLFSKGLLNPKPF